MDQPKRGGINSNSLGHSWRHTDSGRDTDSNTDANSDADADADSNSYTNADSNADTDANADSNSDTDADASFSDADARLLGAINKDGSIRIEGRSPAEPWPPLRTVPGAFGRLWLFPEILRGRRLK